MQSQGGLLPKKNANVHLCTRRKDDKGGERHKHKSLLSLYWADRKLSKLLSFTVHNRGLNASLKYLTSHYGLLISKVNIKATSKEQTIQSYS